MKLTAYRLWIESFFTMMRMFESASSYERLQRSYIQSVYIYICRSSHLFEARMRQSITETEIYNAGFSDWLHTVSYGHGDNT